MKKRYALLLLVVCFSISPIFSQSPLGSVSGSDVVCLNEQEDYTFVFYPTSNLCFIDIVVTGGTASGAGTYFCDQLSGNFCPVNFNYPVPSIDFDVTWTSSGTKKITVNFYKTSTGVCEPAATSLASSLEFVVEEYNETPLIQGPTTVFGNSAYFYIQGQLTNHSWSILPYQPSIYLFNHGSAVTVNGLNGSTSSWHMISLVATDQCGDTYYASKSFYKSGGYYRMPDQEIQERELDLKPSSKATYTMYPNPATDRVTVNLSSSGSHQVLLIDIQGSVLKSTNGESSVDLDVSSLHKGIYFIQVVPDSGEETQTFSLVKQ